LNIGTLCADDKLTLQQWFKTWLFEYKVNEIRPSTLSKYEGLYRNYIKNTQIGMIKLKDLKASNLQAYYNLLTRDKNKTPDTIKTLNKVIKAALTQATAEQYIFLNPCNHVILPKIAPKSEIQIFTLDEQLKFIEAIQDHRQRLVFLLGLGTGLRIGELLGLKWSDIDLVEMELTVRRTLKRVSIIDLKSGTKAEGSKTKIIEQLPKTEYSARTVPIPSTLVKELKKHKMIHNKEKLEAKDLYVNNDLLFPNEIGEPTDERSLTRSYERILKRAGIEHKKFHCLRHTFATRLFEREVPLKTVSILLGHSDIKITADIYTHVMPSEKIKAVDKLNDLFAL
jgi:integrase